MAKPIVVFGGQGRSGMNESVLPSAEYEMLPGMSALGVRMVKPVAFTSYVEFVGCLTWCTGLSKVTLSVDDAGATPTGDHETTCAPEKSGPVPVWNCHVRSGSVRPAMSCNAVSATV